MLLKCGQSRFITAKMLVINFDYKHLCFSMNFGGIFMDNVVNAQRLSDSNVDAAEKLRTSVCLKKDTYLNIDSLIKLSGATPQEMMSLSRR